VIGARPARVLVAGVGNLFLGDDGFGPEVATRLATRPRREGVHVVDFGIRALDLAYALLDGYSLVVLVDAVARGGRPGTLYVLEPELGRELSTISAGPVVAGHSLVPAQVFALVESLGSAIDAAAVRIVGCEPAFIPDDPEIHVGLSEPVAGAIERAVELVESLVAGVTHEPVTVLPHAAS
jgi:hydrogenase maturation protease